MKAPCPCNTCDAHMRGLARRVRHVATKAVQGCAGLRQKWWQSTGKAWRVMGALVAWLGRVVEGIASRSSGAERASLRPGARRRRSASRPCALHPTGCTRAACALLASRGWPGLPHPSRRRHVPEPRRSEDTNATRGPCREDQPYCNSLPRGPTLMQLLAARTSPRPPRAPSVRLHPRSPAARRPAAQRGAPMEHGPPADRGDRTTAKQPSRQATLPAACWQPANPAWTPQSCVAPADAKAADTGWSLRLWERISLEETGANRAARVVELHEASPTQARSWDDGLV